ncbi:hypothetical protein [Salinicola rhizosphaerae]|uniref:Uncharacterized protein n=1 Tax=Salinicola rhizosphaerae TaxID=1443141 RepID=A0ABQ3ECY5_9GAMM|nr:hypothetical protein [Salinicola rhizosphaerae]GHB32466.1 hypothetical protein GCM10009038_34140 [Salinicola rhizosphaerae]
MSMTDRFCRLGKCLKRLVRSPVATAGLLLSLTLTGCAVVPQAEPRSIAVEANAEQTLKATLSMLAERGFVIRHGDGDLGQIDAVLASRSGYEIHAEVTSGGPRPVGVIQPGSTYLTLSGRRGGQPLGAESLDPLFIDVQQRLSTLP